ncbi:MULTISPECIES: hypothetical protein [unclassified Okeania]|uniref:hypothetical protein n=1 Tax=unclassified Okeania TaxID=2634635 RepID=UPI0013C0AAC0|nr:MULTISPECIES: hypothetical protein [unclassified Okeania]NET44757.1 hypothetical protein [Okeania sp. SIO2B3]GGA46066.1 hypothetical protein CYANOKiyG1_65040 [Okeania sp. KiyG1]
MNTITDYLEFIKIKNQIRQYLNEFDWEFTHYLDDIYSEEKGHTYVFNTDNYCYEVKFCIDHQKIKITKISKEQAFVQTKFIKKYVDFLDLLEN